MNDEMKNTNPNGIEKKLLDVAGRTNADPHFVSELESKLKNTHKPKTNWSMPMFKQVTSALGWVALVAVLGYFLNWSFATLIPTQQPGANITPNQFVCAVTEPNGSTPPSEQPSEYFLGNGELWTALWPNGKIYMLPTDKMSDGSFNIKWSFWRGVSGALTVEGHRLDAEDSAIRADITEGYGDTGYQVLALTFPSTGCWEVTGRVGESSLTFVTEVVFGEATPMPDTSRQEISTPDPNRPGFDLRGAKLVLNTILPDSPAQANIYRLLASQPATAAYTQALAGQFGIEGDIYHTTNGQIPDLPAFMVTDGQQQLVVYAENYYTYTSNMVESSRNYIGYQNENAESIIQEYLASHGLEFSYRIKTNPNFDGYVLQQLSPDGLILGHERYSPSMRITFDENGNILNVNTTMLNFESAPLGTYGIISAEQALQNLLDDSLPAGKIESSYGGPNANFIPPQTWYKEYPDDQTVTLYGNVSSSNQPVDPSKPPLVFIGAVQAIGNITGMDTLEYYAFVGATGQFVVENGVRKFNVDAWDQNVQAGYASGFARSAGDLIIITNEDGSDTEYTLVDPPTDLPLNTKFPESMLISNGAVVDGSLYWTSIQYYADSSQMGGGGGGGGMGFYPLNLSGTPMPFPTATPAQPGYTPAELASFLRYTVQPNDTLSSIAANFNVSIEDIKRVNNMPDETVYLGIQIVIPGVLAPTRVDGEHGTVVVTIYQKPDGRQRTQYIFLSEKDQAYYELTGDNLEPLQEVANRPIALWGSIHINTLSLASINVEKFENLYPDLQFQVLEGTQETTEINGTPVILFTTSGTTYIQLVSSGGYPDSNYYTDTKDVLIEALQVPNETYAGYPAMRVFNVAPALNPVTKEKMELPRTTDKLEPIPDPYGNSDQYTAPDITIATVELVYYVSIPYYPDGAPNSSQTETYVQPAWHFLGHDTNGGIVDILIQALKQEYLSPIPQ